MWIDIFQQGVSNMQLSIVATLYNSSSHIQEFYSRSSKVASDLFGESYEIILVNDGSPDDGLQLAIHLAENDSHVVVIDLSRNFGHHQAMIAGLKHAAGEKIFLIDSDLEEEPEWLSLFAENMEALHCDVVFGRQAKRKGGWFERVTGWLFYRLFNLLTGYDFPKNVVTSRLMSRRYLDAFLLYGEREISIGGLFFITGFDQQPLEVKKHDSSQTTYSFRQKISVLVNSIVSFSSKPLVGIFVLGVIVLLISSLVSVFYIVNAILIGEPPSGWTSLMVSVWVLGGIVISSIGVLGIYLSKVYTESKQRPSTIIRKVYGRKQGGMIQ
jgi:putative glycosyltransferase